MTLEELKYLDLEGIGQWPRQVKWGVVLMLILAVLGLGGHFLVGEGLSQLRAEQQRETELKRVLKDKFQFSAHLERHQQQLLQAQLVLKEMLGMLPKEDEMPGLLDDITYLATRTDLTILSIGWLPEQPGELYVTLPLKVELSGRYPQFGEFVASLAALPRIVNLQDLSLNRGEPELTIELVARTYRLSEAPGEETP